MLTITTTHNPATDLGFLLYKHPDKLQTFDLSFGKAHVFYPHATSEECTVALALEIDPVRLTRGGGNRGSTPQMFLQHYINDRPYAATSHLSVAISQVFRTAMTGRCDERPELAVTPIPLEAQVSSVKSRWGSDLLQRLFEPLGYQMEARTRPLDKAFPQWGEGPYHDLTLRSEKRTLQELLTHLYVLLPVMDNDKHYWIGKDEVEKLMRFGEGWLAQHPERDIISRRYLGHRRSLVDSAQEMMIEEKTEDTGEEAADAAPDSQETPKVPGESRTTRIREGELERPMMLGEQRIQAVMEAVRKSNAASVLDLGCGEGRLLRELAGEKQLQRITGVEASAVSLERAKRRMKPEQRRQVELLHGSLVYPDPRLAGHDAAILMEVIEHIDPPRLPAFREAVLGVAQPGVVIITTPNVEYNVLFTSMTGQFRHRDHRFEWTRKEFQNWVREAAGQHGYEAEFHGIGQEHQEHGHPTQMAILTRRDAEEQNQPQGMTDG